MSLLLAPAGTAPRALPLAFTITKVSTEKRILSAAWAAGQREVKGKEKYMC